MKALIAALALSLIPSLSAAADIASSRYVGGATSYRMDPLVGLYPPVVIPTKAQLYVLPRGQRFKVLVVPNVVGYRRALAEAGRVAGAFCRQRHGTNRVGVDGVERHSRIRLDAWEVNGRCR